jgi:PhnB protein
MQLNPHLSFDGQCEEAFRFYAKCLGGKIHMMLTDGDSPMASQTPPEWGKKILHASIKLNDQELIGADVMERYQKPRGFSLILHLEDATEADRIFGTLAEKGTVQMPLQETFWALRFGECIDRFGIPWTINCGKGMPADH